MNANSSRKAAESASEKGTPAARPGQGSGRGMLIALLPLIVFLALALIFYKQLADGGASSDIPSALIGKPAPEVVFAPLEGLKQAGAPVPPLTPELLRNIPAGKLAIVNVWASWCGPCRQEHPVLVELGKEDAFSIYGINYKDRTQNALRFLGQLGNPYDAVGVDPKGRGAIEWGVYGIPESFIVGADGAILAKHVGPLTQEAVEKTIRPLLTSSGK